MYKTIVLGLLEARPTLYRRLRLSRTLMAELPGYADYAARVRYRLIPKVW